MKQLDSVPTSISFKEINTVCHFEKFLSKAEENSKQKRKALHFLCTMLFVTAGFCFAPTEVNAQWADDFNHFNVFPFYVPDGSIGINIMIKDNSNASHYEWLDSGTLKYNLDGGSSYTTFATLSPVAGHNTVKISATDSLYYLYSNSSTQTWVTIYLLASNYNSRLSNIKISGTWHELKEDNIAGLRPAKVPLMSSFDLAPVDFVTMFNTQTNMYEARTKVGYKKPKLNGIDSVSKVQLIGSDYSAQGPLHNVIDTNYSYDYVNTGNEAYYYYLQQAYFDYTSHPYGRINSQSQVIIVPAFSLPQSAVATYDTINHNAIFTWKIDPVPNAIRFIKNNFLIQVSGDASFKNFTEDSVIYNTTNASFSYTTQNLFPKMYFRVSRDYNSPDWHLWDVAKEDSIVIPFVNLDANSTKATLQADNSVLITWKPDPAAWLPGSLFIITKYNNTIGTQSQINLTEKDFDSGYYIDKQVATCTEYVYTLQVIPPSASKFNAYPPVSVNGSIIRADIGKLLTMNASKGYFPDRTELNWTSSGSFDNFIIKRSVYGANNYVQIFTVPASFGGSFQVDDEKGMPGTYYSYMIIGYLNCNKTPVYAKDTLYAIGFRSPTGNIHGRITYVNGQAVQNASVRVQSKDAIQQGQSVYFDGDASSYIILDSLNKPFTDSAATIEAWIKPTDASPENQVIFSHGGQYELGFDNEGKLYFTYKGTTVTGGYRNPNQSFIHVAGVHSNDSLSIFLNDSLVSQPAGKHQHSKGTDAAVYIGRSKIGNNYKGYIDEMRVWNIALSDSIIARDYTRILTGGENGLAAYWRFDETIPYQFYDLSYNNTVYNRNDGNIKGTAVHSPTIPTQDQLSFKSYTDSTGNYLIAGIPYIGNGTTYSIVPLLGIHQFDPVSDSRFISASSTDFTVNFTDKSSFPVSGTIYYSNTTVPVSGVQLKIDGQYAQTSDGALIQTDDAGNFNITVPVGIHKVQAVKNNHVFEKNGEILDKGKEIDYQSANSGVKLYDSTTIRFIGRVCGGTIQAAYPLGYSLSKNNLGDNIGVVMKLAGGSAVSLNTDGTVRQDTVKHLQLSDPKDSDQIHKTVVDYFNNRIVIHPDSLTGEFAANIIPEKFIADSINVTGWDFSAGAQFDFSNKFINFTTGYNYQDSVLKNSSQPDSGYVRNTYTDSVSYNDSAIFTKRVSPSINIAQIDSAGNKLSYFGDSTYSYQLVSGDNISMHVIDFNKSGKNMYVLGHPVFSQKLQYIFKISSFEAYPFNNDNETSSNTDTVVVTDGQINIDNEIRAGSTGTDVLQLDSSGSAYYIFFAGDPDLSDALESFSATVQVGESTYVHWKAYDGNNEMQVYNVGSKATGTDFVTQGPNNMIMILRDPPGSRSFSYMEKGSSFKTSTTFSTSHLQTGGTTGTLEFGTKLLTWVGIGAGVITETKATLDASLSFAHEEHWATSKTKSETNTITDHYQTSDDPAFVGELGDVFVGHSTNITYGSGTSIIIVNKKQDKDSLRVSDIILSDSTNQYVIVKRSSLEVGQEFGTLFAYTQQYVEYQTIPHLKGFISDVLNKYPVNLDAGTAQHYADITNQPVYISHLSADNPGFGKSNSDPIFGTDTLKPYYNGDSYTIYYPSNHSSSFMANDTILTINQYINDWTALLSENEKEKLNAALIQNYSFHAGSPISHTEQIENDKTDSHTFSFVVTGGIAFSGGFELNDLGYKVELNLNEGGGRDSSWDTTFTNTNTTGFTLASNGTDDNFTVDVKDAKDGSGLVYITKGGESACPYEGASYTKYYEPGTIINEPTVQIEVPKFDVDTHEVDNVPASRPAVFNLTLRNESEAKLPATYILGYVDNNSIKGATIAVDGVSIGGAGRAIVVQYGQTVNKVLTITKGPKAMNYDSIMIIWHSSCQYDPTSYLATIADTQIISAHFIPSCSDVHISDPIADWRLNTQSPVDSTGKRFLPVTIDDFDMTNSLFDHIELQYKSSAAAEWFPAASFYADTSTLNAAPGSDKYLITDPAKIDYRLDMGNTQFPDQNYDLRAVSFCVTGIGNPPVVTPSDVVSGIKDTLTPRLFGNPEPGNGILGLDNNIKATFNEPIEAGLLSNNNLQVTGIRNGSQGDNSVSVSLDGKNDYLSTEFAKNFSGKSITAEMWMLPDASGHGTLFSQGSPGNSMELTLTADKHLQVIIGSKTIKSNALDYKQDWSHVALVYNNDDSTVSAFYNFKEVISAVSVPKYKGAGNINFGRSINTQSDFFKGKIHEARIWSKTITGLDLQTNSHTILSGSENNLLAYYPMNEGEGNISHDIAHGSNATIIGNWSTPPGRAVAFHGHGYLKLNTSSAPVDSSMDYTLELWFKAGASERNTALACNGKADGTDGGGSKNVFFLGFENGLLTYENNSFKVQADGNYLDDNWHHVAVAVNRISGTAQLYADGKLNKYFDASNVGGMEGAIYLGVRAWSDKDSAVTNYDRYFTGSIDEFRIWNSYMDQTLITKNNNVRLKGNELGLKTYYPFETYTTNSSGITSLDSAWQDLTAKGSHSYATGKNAMDTSASAPIKSAGPVVNLSFDYVVNNDALIINMLEPKSAIDKTIVTLRVKDVADKNGNYLASPITWTAYIDQDQLKWSDDELNLEKDLNAPMQVEAYIQNKGGTLQHFRLNALPVWLSADVTSGTIEPEGKKKIVFTINQGLNIGVYNEIVYLYDDNNETEGLGINVTVKGKQPAWVVNPGDYKYNMNVYGKIRINDVFSSNAGDMLAAFADGKCVGVAHNTYFSSNDLWYAFLTIYNNSVSYNKLEFRIWDASTGKTYKAVPSTPIDFSNDAVIGTSSKPVIFDGKNFVYQNIDITQGWNWISLNVTPPNSGDVAATLANGDWQSGDIIKNNDIGFDDYSSTSGWLGTLPTLNNTSMFMLSTSNAQNLSVMGAETDVKKIAIPLKGGRWSYISYLPQVNMSVKQAMAGYDASDQDVIKSQTGFAMYDSQNGWIGNLSYLEPGKGYMLYRKSTGDTSFYYPESAIEGLRHVSMNNDNETPVASNFNYAENMTVVAVIGKEYSIQPGDIILANVGNEIRGKAKIIHNAVIKDGSLFFNISGQSEQPVYFTLQRHGKIIASSDAMFAFHADYSAGTLSSPLVIHLKKNNAELISAYPNPFDRDINIIVDLPTGQSQSKHEVQISVYNSIEQLILTRGKEQVYGNRYQTTWNGRRADGSACTAGIYFINVMIDDSLHIYKVIKN